jgi:diguanylate cyclase (GGDEF)-like protein
MRCLPSRGAARNPGDGLPMPSLSLAEWLFLAARIGIAVTCLAAAAAALRHMALRDRAAHRPRPLLGAASAILVIGAILGLHDAQERMRALDGGVWAGAWLWLLFDLAVPLLTLRMLRVMTERDAALKELATLSSTDPLTGLPNRRGFEARATAALTAAREAGRPCCALVLDLDRFKAINDGFGHPAGDAVLQATADALRGVLREADLPGRLGGEEFGVLLPDCDAAGGVLLAERLRAAISAEVAHPDPARTVTVSIGVAALGAGPPGRALGKALAAADRALYAAKAAGRDRVKLA